MFSPGVAGLGSHVINYTFTAINGCTYSTSQQINVQETPVITIDSVFTMLQGGQINFNATVTAPGEGLTYKWSPSAGLSNTDILNPVVSPSNDTQYTLTVTAADGCSAVAHLTVNVLLNIVIPNTFTPNGDGINDFWEIQHLESYPNCIVQIFNRYGEKLYYSVGYPTPWDGKYKGSNLPTGTYYYIIDPKNGRKQVSGFVTIIR
jgi:gliding motility-associated-like protein